MAQWPFQTEEIIASSPTAPALANIACTRNAPPGHVDSWVIPFIKGMSVSFMNGIR